MKFTPACVAAFFFAVAVAHAEPPALQNARSDIYSGLYENGEFQSLTFVNPVVGWSTFFNNGFYGVNRVIGNIEAGHVWGGHEAFLRPGNFPAAIARTVTGTGALNEIDFHATMVGHVLAGTGYVAEDDVYQFVGLGMAPAAALWSGAIATSYSATTVGSFETTTASTISVYRSFFQGNGTVKPDAINSSWGGGDASAISPEMLAIDGLATQNPTVALVTSAGNAGSAPVSAPGAAFNGITVGSLGGGSFLVPSDFSSSGPVDFFNPVSGITHSGVRAAVDLAAPGELLVLAAYLGKSGSLNASEDQDIQALLQDSPVSDLYFLNQDGTSFSAPIVAGGIALLKDAAARDVVYNLNAVPTASDTRVIKSVLMAGATRTVGWNNGQTLGLGGVVSTTTALDPETGAGALNLDNTVGIYLLSGTRDLPGAGGGTVSETGWDYASVALSGANDYFFATEFETEVELAVSLNWFAGRTFDNGSDTGENLWFSNIDLEIWRTTGNAFTSLYAESSSIYNNTEFLRLNLPAGSYGIRVAFGEIVFEVTEGSVLFEEYGIAWQTIAVPEVSTALLISVAGGVLLLRFRRRRVSCRTT